MTIQNNQTALSELLAKAAGPLHYGLTNDYMFRALLQKNNEVLKALIGSLLHMPPEKIISAEITNPIVLGSSINEKEFILDVHVILNSHTLIDLEMQVINYQNWSERSLGYLCRTFDNLNRGDDYIHTKSAIHISFLDFTLFPRHPEFYATYMLSNVKNHTIYSDKFMLSVVDLNHIELATPSDKQFRIDYWAALFKATTWEDIKMISNENNYFQSASETLFQLNADERIREQCEARNAYYARERYHRETEEKFKKAITENSGLKTENTNLKAEIARLLLELEALQKN